MNEAKYIINQQKIIIDAIKQINSIGSGPLCLFVVDDEGIMRGSLTDGDIRRAIDNGANTDDAISQAMNRSFNCLYKGNDNSVVTLRQLRQSNIKLIPVLDSDGRICEIIDLQRHITKLPIDAVIMAGGRGERLRPLTQTTPKPLLKVGDKAIIDYNVERLINYGIERISVTVNYLGEQIEEHFKQVIGDVKVNCVREPKYFGTIGSVKCVDGFSNDTILVMNSDLFTNIDFEDFYIHFKMHEADMSVAAIPYSVTIPYGVFNLEGRVIRGIQEKPTYTYYANAGVYLIKRKLIEEIPSNKFYNATDFIEKLVSNGRKVVRFPLTGYWIDIGSHEEYQKAQELVKHLHL